MLKPSVSDNSEGTSKVARLLWMAASLDLIGQCAVKHNATIPARNETSPAIAGLRVHSVRPEWLQLIVSTCRRLADAVHVDRIPRGRPEFADSQRTKILELLRHAGSAGISREELIFNYRWTQAGTRIHELEKMGFVIRHASVSGQRFVRYILVSEPDKIRPLAAFNRKASDWCEQRATGLPLFDLAVKS